MIYSAVGYPALGRSAVRFATVIGARVFLALAHMKAPNVALRTVLVTAASMLLTLTSPFAQAAEPVVSKPINVVASFSVLADMVNEIGGGHISLTTIVGPDGDAHSFEPTPRDAKALAQAQILFVNGLAFEGWLPRLVKSSGFRGLEVVASKGVKPRLLSESELALHAMEDDSATGERAHAQTGRAEAQHARAADEQDRAGDSNVRTGNTADATQDHVLNADSGAIDPHAWQSLQNGMIYAQNIANGLAQIDPGNAKYYQDRAKIYIAEMKKLDAEIKLMLGAIPKERRRVVTSHDALGYFGQAYGVQFISATGFSNDAEPSAKEVAGIIDQIKKDHIPAVFVENITNPKLIKRIAHETHAKVGGTLYSDALAKPDQPAGTYLGMFSWNAGQLIYALQP